MRELLCDNIALEHQLGAIHGYSPLQFKGAARPRLRDVSSLTTWCYCFLGYMDTWLPRPPVIWNELSLSSQVPVGRYFPNVTWQLTTQLYLNQLLCLACSSSSVNSVRYASYTIRVCNTFYIKCTYFLAESAIMLLHVHRCSMNITHTWLGCTFCSGAIVSALSPWLSYTFGGFPLCL